MAEQLPINFPLPSESAVASYNYVDVETGLGITTYYLAQQKDDGGVDYIMTPYTLASHRSVIVFDAGWGAATTFTFYSGVFNSPRYLKGRIDFNFCAAFNGTAGATMEHEVKVYHYDGSSSTQIGGTWTSETLTLAAATETMCANGSITSTGTNFKKGDQIKVEVILNRTGSYGDYELGIDPQARDSDQVTPLLVKATYPNLFTNFTMDIPFRVEL